MQSMALSNAFAVVGNCLEPRGLIFNIINVLCYFLLNQCMKTDWCKKIECLTLEIAGGVRERPILKYKIPCLAVYVFAFRVSPLKLQEKTFSG